MEKLKCPDLRFGGFSENWEQSNFLDNIQSIVDYRGRTPKKLGMDWSKSGYLALSALNVKNGYIDPSIDAHYGDEKLYQKWMGGNELKKGQVLFTTEAPMGNVAQVPDDTGYILSQRTIAFNVEKKKISDTFLAVLLGSPNVFNRLSELCSGGTAKGVSQKSLSTLEVIFPKELNEQTQIGNFFQNLDQSIALHEKKLAQTQNLKKAMLEKMFPKAGSTQPEIRLKGFSGEWEQRKLGDISEIKTGPFGSTLHADDYVNNGTPIVTTEHFKSGELPEQTKGIPQVSESDFCRLNNYILKTDDIVFSRVGSVDINALVTSFQAGWLFSGRVLRVRSYDYVWSSFLHYELSTERAKNDVIIRAVGQTMPSINTEILKITKVYLPKSKVEQIQIGQFFKQLDETLVLQQQQLQTLKNLKQAFLEKMFV